MSWQDTSNKESDDGGLSFHSELAFPANIPTPSLEFILQFRAARHRGSAQNRFLEISPLKKNYTSSFRETIDLQSAYARLLTGGRKLFFRADSQDRIRVVEDD